MIDDYEKLVAVAMGLVNGIGWAIAATLLDLEFEKALIIAAIGGMFGVISATVSAIFARREARKVAEDLRAIKGAVGVNKRATDHIPPEV